MMGDRIIERKLFPDGIFYELHSVEVVFRCDTIWVIVTNNYDGKTTLHPYVSESLSRNVYLAMIEGYEKRLLNNE